MLVARVLTLVFAVCVVQHAHDRGTTSRVGATKETRLLQHLSKTTIVGVGWSFFFGQSQRPQIGSGQEIGEAKAGCAAEAAAGVEGGSIARRRRQQQGCGPRRPVPWRGRLPATAGKAKQQEERGRRCRRPSDRRRGMVGTPNRPGTTETEDDRAVGRCMPT